MSTATTELRQFLTINCQCFKDGRSAPEMFSPAVDAAWHELLGTVEYNLLREETAVQPIRHVANNGCGPIAWVAAYGTRPDIWFTDAHGTVDEQAVARYRTTVTVVADQQALREVGTSFVAHPESIELVQPGEGPFPPRTLPSPEPRATPRRAIIGLMSRFHSRRRYLSKS